jgi:thiol-disulfide isomerase/thioredoxin
MRMRWAIAILGVAALAALTVTTQMPWLARGGPAMEETAPAGDARANEDAAPLSCPADAKQANLDFTLKDVDHRDVSLASYKGKVILLDFWATWCAPCKVEIPHFIEFQEKYGKDGLQIIGISMDDTIAEIVPYAKEMKMNYPVLHVGESQAGLDDAFGPIVGIPVSVMISRDGKICAIHSGLTGRDVFEREINSLL